MFQLDLTPIVIQGIAKYDAISKKLVIGDTKPFTEVVFGGFGAYIRETGFETAKREEQMGCYGFRYSITKEYAFVYFDFVNKFTLDSVKKTAMSQLNQFDIVIKTIKADFATIKKEENNIMKDANLLKIVFESTEYFINDCEGLICVC